MNDIPTYMEIEELRIPVICQRSNRKTLAITVTSKGELLVKVPSAMREKEIGRFLAQKRYWIYKQAKRALQDAQDRTDRSDEEIRTLKIQARQVLTQRTDKYKALLGVDYQKIRIGDQKTRWGSCSSKGTISYNWHLILMPERIMDYVIVHELCHLREMNHSKRFWQLVEEILPDYASRRKWLKENGNRYL
ncbi:MAG: M48 family metallopeptidase [Bacteroidales bacterium]|nr:M48 family metallopeptidase [Clostridium sp.]MCM1205014.1 M48 family metallopeptidase [Bacteroidales bacterium]